MLEVSKLERQEERNEYAAMRSIENEQQEAAEKKREKQRKDQEIQREAERRNDVQRMEKLKKRREEQRVEEQERREEQQILDQRAHNLLPMNMMKNMLQGNSVQPQSTNTGAPTQASISTSQNEQELVLLMKQANLTQTSVEPTKQYKSNANMDMTGNPTPTADMSNAESQLPVDSTQPPAGGHQ